LNALASRDVTTRTEVDAQERVVLSQQQRVQDQTNLLNLLPTRLKAQQANLALKQARLADAQLDLERTEIRAPFDCRLGEVTLEIDQYVVAGEVLFEAAGTDLVEVEAQVSPRDVRRLFRKSRAQPLATIRSMDQIREIFDVDVIVELTAADIPARWPAEFMRIRETLDTQTRSLSLVVGVKESYKKVIPGKQPPLLEGAYCRVTLIGQKREQQPVIPRHALRDGHVYLLDADQRLRRQTVRIEFVQDQFAAVSEGLSGGETLVVSDPTPAVEGMLVKPVDDQTLLDALIRDARGPHTDERQTAAARRPAPSGDRP
jgi:RND family efflux transporter MFP subunit